MVSQGIGGHEGYSGTPLWKVAEQNQKLREFWAAESLAYASQNRKPPTPPNVLVDAVSVGGPADKATPLVRHVLVKCLRKVAERLRIELPKTGIFAGMPPVGLFALFDGQSCAGEPGPEAAEFCARNFHKKVIDNLASLPSECTSETFVKAALIKSFEDLDKDLVDSLPDTTDGCGAAVALIVGDSLFTAVLGTCGGIVCEVEEPAGGFGSGQATAGRAVPMGRSQSGVNRGPGFPAVSRSLGDPAWKRLAQTQNKSSLISCIPEIQSVKLSWAEKHSLFLLATKPVLQAVGLQQQVDAAMYFPGQPRAACGEIAALATEHIKGGGAQAADALPQCTIVEVWLLQGGPNGGSEEAGSALSEAIVEPAKKKVKAGPGAVAGSVESARLRHILVRYQPENQPPQATGSKKVTPLRSRMEAEALLRQIMRELRAELIELRKKPGQSKRQDELALKSERFAKLCREHSECPTGHKGGGMCGDLGWVSKDQQRKMGAGFQEAVSALKPGDWSDIVASTDGLHLLQRIA